MDKDRQNNLDFQSDHFFGADDFLREAVSFLFDFLQIRKRTFSKGTYKQGSASAEMWKNMQKLTSNRKVKNIRRKCSRKLLLL